jgi:hypothetical protein
LSKFVSNDICPICRNMASGLSIKPKTRNNKLDSLKEIIRAWGLNPKEILTRDAMREPNRTIIDRSEIENHQLNQLTSELKQQILKEIQQNQPEKKYELKLGEK